jgi:hypothetical protein
MLRRKVLPWQLVSRRRAPVLVLNIKGVKTDDTLCLLRLADLERLVNSKEPQP